MVRGNQVEFNQLACTQSPVHVPKRTNRTCVDGVIIEIGFIAENNWLSLMEICHDEELGSSSWVHYYQNPENLGYQRSYPRISFIQGGFYRGLQVNRLYTRNEQRHTFGEILGSIELSEKLIAQRGDLFLSRGHLAARSDYIYGSQQQATFYFLNAAPQWQSFNGGNWAILEDHLKRYVDRQSINVDIYTGTHGILTFEDVYNEPQKLFLASNGTDQRIPVPKIFYKVVIAESLNKGIVFIGINNPYATLKDIERDYTYCDNVMDQVNYIPWNRNNIQMGHLYACDVNEFADFIGKLPILPEIDDLLL